MPWLPTPGANGRSLMRKRFPPTRRAAALAESASLCGSRAARRLQVVDAWNATGMMMYLQQHKEVVVEPRKKVRPSACSPPTSPTAACMPRHGVAVGTKGDAR